MKTFQREEVETLRAEVRALRTQVNRLEERLADFQSGDDEEMRALWPYNWVLSGVESVKNVLDTRRESRRRPQRKRFDSLDGETRFGRMMM